MTRTILHVDLDAFYCSVEELLNPQLKGKVFVVGGSPEGRGVVSSASYAARKFGVRSAMPTAQALRRCPHLLVLSGRHETYSAYSKRVMALLRAAAPVMEQLSIDEAFLDVSGDPRPGEQVAAQLKQAIREQFDLPTSWGVASNKLVAKVATEVGKPDGLVVVPPGQEAQFLAPLPVDMLWGVGPVTKERLESVGIDKIGDLASCSDRRLVSLLGDHGPDLATRARGEDDRPVVEEREPKSISAERTFPKDISDGDELRRILLRLSERVGYRVRKDHFTAKTVRIKLRWQDFTTITRQKRLTQATDRDGDIFTVAVDLFNQAWRQGRPVRLLGVGVSELGPPLRQLSLFDQGWKKEQRLYDAIDHLRERFGRDVIRRAGSVDPTRLEEDGIDEEIDEG
jgi:DNA polymerase-4